MEIQKQVPIERSSGGVIDHLLECKNQQSYPDLGQVSSIIEEVGPTANADKSEFCRIRDLLLNLSIEVRDERIIPRNTSVSSLELALRIHELAEEAGLRQLAAQAPSIEG